MGRSGEQADPPYGRSGHRRRFDELSRLCGGRARKYVQLKLGAVLRRRVDSEDVLQEVLLDASQLFIQDGQGAELKDSEFFPWLAKIIENKIKNLARYHVAAKRRSVKREVQLLLDGGMIPYLGDKTPSTELMQAEWSDRLHRAMRALSPKQREVVNLVHFERLRVSEAALRMGKTAGATSVLLHEALDRLRKALKQREP